MAKKSNSSTLSTPTRGIHNGAVANLETATKLAEQAHERATRVRRSSEEILLARTAEVARRQLRELVKAFEALPADRQVALVPQIRAVIGA